MIFNSLYYLFQMFFPFKKTVAVAEEENYKLVFCDEPDIRTKFGEYGAWYSTYESAEWAIKSKANGWGNNLGREENGAFEVLNDFGNTVSWIMIVDKDGNIARKTEEEED